MSQITIILNPKAGRGRGTQLRAELERLLTAAAPSSPAVWKIVETRAKGHASELARQAVGAGAAIIAAAGGDGTLNEVVNGLMAEPAESRQKVMLGLLPLGTGNDFARCIGLGTDIKRSVETLFQGRPQFVDVGQAHGRWFVNIAGCGFDAIVAERANRGFPFLRGTSAYLAAIAHSLLHLKSAELTLTLDGETRHVRALMCSVANATSYGGGMMVTPDARIDDGLFDICLLAEAGRLEFVRAFPRVFKGTHITHSKVTMLRARTVHIESHPPLPLLIDGEVTGTTPVTFTLSPRALQVMTPVAPGGSKNNAA